MKTKRIVSILLAVIMLLFVAPISFAGDNSTQENAISVVPGEEVVFTAEADTEYWYSIETNQIGQFIKVESNFRDVVVYDSDGKCWTCFYDKVANVNIHTASTGEAGMYYLYFYNPNSESQEYAFTVTLMENDAYELNNTADTAKSLVLGQEYTVIGGGADSDWFTFVTTKPGQIVCVEGDYDNISIYVPEGEDLESLDSYSNGVAEWYITQKIGTYHLRATCPGTDARYITFSVELLDNDAHELNNTEKTATELTAGIPVDFILGGRDYDYFLVETTRNSQDVQIDFSGFNYATEGSFSAYFDDVKIGTINSNGTYYLHATNAGKHIIELYNGKSTEQFTMTATVLDGDANEPNDSLEVATRLPIGTDKTFSMGGKGDEDWFTFESAFDEGESSKMYTLNLLDLNTDYSDRFYYDLYAPDGTLLMDGIEVEIRHNNIIACEQEGLYALCLYRTSSTSPRSDLRIRVDEGGADPYEPNDTWLTAAEVQPEQPIQFILSNTEDADWFRIDVPEANMTLKLQSDSTVECYLYSAASLEEFGINSSLEYEDLSGSYYYQLGEPGVYYMCFTSGQSYPSTDVRTITPTLEAAKDVERNNTWKTATPIYEGVPTNYDLTAWNDYDWFVFEIPEGVKELLVDGSEDGSRYLYREKDFEAAGDDAAYIKNGDTISVSQPEAGVYYLRCTGGRAMDQTVTYYLYTEARPAQSMEDAQPITEGQWMEDIYGGYYELGNLSAGDEIRLYGDNIERVYLYNASGEQQWNAYMGDVQNTCRTISADGDYYLKVTPYTKYSNGQYQPYRLLYDLADRELSNGEVFVFEGPDTINLLVGQTAEVDLRLIPYDAKCNYTGNFINYNSSADTAVAKAGYTYGKGYYVTGESLGTTTVRYYLNGNYGATKTVTVNVVEPKAQTVAILGAPSQLALGSSTRLTAEIQLADASDTITWISSDPKVLYVSETGRVTAVGDGAATITATASSGVSASVTITVTDAPAKPVVTGLTLDDYDLTLYMGEGDGQLSATVSPADSPVAVGWVSSNLKAAIVDQNGKITLVAPGVTVITASAGDYRASCIVTVQPDRVNVESIAFDTAVLEIPLSGESALRPIFTPSDATVKSMTWASSDTNVASVSRTGIVNALAVGETTITATTLDGGKQASIVIRVIAAPQPGDINGDGYVDAADAMITLQVAVGKVELNDAEFEAADVNGDGWVDAADAVRILRYDAGLIDSLEN